MKPERRSLLGDAALAGVAGFIGTIVMERVSMKLYGLESAEARDQEERVWPGPPYRIAAEKMSNAVGVELTEQQLDPGRRPLPPRLGRALGSGLSLLRRGGFDPVGAGLLTGASLSLMVDAGLTPGARIQFSLTSSIAPGIGSNAMARQARRTIIALR